MCPESFDDVRFDLGARLEGRMWSLIPIMVYISLIIGRRGLDVKTTYGKSCAPNFWFRFDLQPESFDDVRFDLGARLEGQMWSLILIMTYISLIIGRTL